MGGADESGNGQRSVRTCSFTGHRVISRDKLNYINHWLSLHIQACIQNKYKRFISGFADGADLLFAAMVAEMQKDYPDVILEAAIPFRDRLYCKDPLFQGLLGKCRHVEVVSEDFSPGCYEVRNSYLAEQASLVIAVYNGSYRSGTAQTIRIAEKLGREIIFISI